MSSQTETAFLKLVNQHKGILYKASRIYADSLEDREDLQQEILIQLWKSYQNFKGNSEFSTWMYRVAINTAITYLKKEKQRTSNQTDVPGHFEVQNEDYNPAKDKQLEVFYSAVQELKALEKAIIFYFMEGMSHKEIGENLGLSEVNARVKLNRTKEKIQQIIKKSGYEF
ncbi:RNA polymerase sigma factor [Chryseobacterium carnipullorum]|uniref:RNA polymerase sigma factor n=1 Tax=Chryseobacterium carnipullorum TaxID=1124835 RepID=A0A376EUR1_CHRCU|nr:RNA polymerase sigma factor [Chryseobacterium carnipullorum]AZA48094.1 RNA polymerase sigma factor [Chryseobacterium carnipullorum]AZA67407.1 RNA polymerase sigma factor [Chryseobacterium carnipullorum]STD13918.1 Sigma-24 [Chryseobacterium carnipullorum]